MHDTVLAPRGWRTHYAGPLPFLGAVFLFTSALSCLVSNAACVVLVYGVLKDLHDGGGLAALRPAQVMLAMMMGASASFATPIGYQTNLMVLQPGGYSFADFARLGVPLTLSTALCAAASIYSLPASWLP
ncbi:hypothetical protein EMIHUDRAFT_111101 [Emiliania huxleyi CCMP1516]|uniref:Citrate transporter-like domain-containing protein n=2 Tax=Emiliania huxleyi TaxID=2903 RepID=A0A0D3KG34_EMIH1|nr:hypothetical protein EMIHUDRAFT_111101 [Emiliania huxleyi CCMP1516]EOD34719.1 hypothetical protein EMIHUDRAFT_111101 [Emiliania huxleyi CCMP1516]|eukprot:XP_005787148.1 hypothetical protein EMIHUDRAFT_111101 [Emiliania huxleyi CCMP1516]